MVGSVEYSLQVDTNRETAMERVQISLGKELLEAVRREARSKGLSVAAFVRLVLMERLEERK